jgi:hypothetical protein
MRRGKGHHHQKKAYFVAQDSWRRVSQVATAETTGSYSYLSPGTASPSFFEDRIRELCLSG